MLAQIVLFEGFDPLDVVAPYDVLLAGGAVAGGALAVELVSADGPGEVPSGAGPLSLRATAALDPRRADLVVVPGAAGDPDTTAAHLARAAASGLSAALRAAAAEPATTVAAVCGGSMVLAMAGLLVGRPAVTHHTAMGALAEAGAVPVAARVVDDGDLVTSAGVTSGLDLALHLLDRELGPRVAHAVESLFAYERRGVVWRAKGLEPVGF